MNLDKYVYKTELHFHTSPASPCAEIPPQKAVEMFAREGYHSVVVSNHFFPDMQFVSDKQKCLDAYLEDYDLAVEAGKKYGVNVILGCELRFRENPNDYLLFGIDRDFLSIAYDYFDTGIVKFSEMFRSQDHLLIQAHPFRNGMTQVDPKYLDGIETFNMHPHHNSRVAMAAKYAKEHHLLMTVGTDFHHSGHQGICGLLTETELKTSQDIVNVLKSRNYLFDIGGCKLIP